MSALDFYKMVKENFGGDSIVANIFARRKKEEEAKRLKELLEEQDEDDTEEA